MPKTWEPKSADITYARGKRILVLIIITWLRKCKFPLKCIYLSCRSPNHDQRYNGQTLSTESNTYLGNNFENLESTGIYHTNYVILSKCYTFAWKNHTEMEDVAETVKSEYLKINFPIVNCPTLKKAKFDESLTGCHNQWQFLVVRGILGYFQQQFSYKYQCGKFYW